MRRVSAVLVGVVALVATALAVPTGAGADPVAAPAATRVDPPGTVTLVKDARQRRDVAIAPGGRVVYDDTSAGNPLWQRQVSVTAGAVVSGPASKLATGAFDYPLSASGARTSFPAATEGQDVTVLSPLQATLTDQDLIGLSGNRGYGPGPGFPGTSVIDVNTGEVTGPVDSHDDGLAASALFGDYVVFGSSDGSVYRKQLSSAKHPERLLGPGGRVMSVATWGDWVAAVRVVDNDKLRLFVLNTATGSVRTAAARDSEVSANAAGYVTGRNTLTSWGGTQTLAPKAFTLVATATVAVWLAPDGALRAAPVPWTTPDVPRSLGNPTAPGTAQSGSTWAFDLPSSAPLTSCTVQILRGSSLVRSLPCVEAYTGGGDAVVQWDLTNTAGRAVAPGTFTWRVVAANADGPLVRASGVAGSVSGTFAVTAAASRTPVR